MTELKTKKTGASVDEFIASIDDETKRQDSHLLMELFKQCTREEPVMWGPSIVGYGTYHYKSERSRQEGDWMMTGFSPRKQNLTLYIMPGFDSYKGLLAKLGKHKTSVSCLYINKLSDVDLDVLRSIVVDAYKVMQQRYH